MRINHQAFLQSVRAKRAGVIVGLAVAGVATTAQAEESIGGAQTVVNLVTGALSTGANVNVFEGDDVFRDEGVRTDADSSARLVLRDNTNLLLGPSSSIRLDRFVYAGPSQPGAIAVNLVKGALRFATGDADKKAYLISTPTAALGVRGTVLKIVSNPSKTFVVLDEGGAIVCTRAAAGKHCAQLTESNQAVVVTATGIKWDSTGGAGVAAVFAAFPDPPGEPSGPGGGRAIVTPAVTTPAITTPAVTTPVITTRVVTTPAIATPAVATPPTVTTKPPSDKCGDDRHDRGPNHDHDHDGRDGHDSRGLHSDHGHGR